MSHSQYISNVNSHAKNMALVEILNYRLSIIDDFISNILDEKGRLTGVNELIVSIIQINSAIEEISRRLTADISLRGKYEKTFPEMLGCLSYEFKINIEPFVFFRILRNKLSHVVYPEKCINTFLYQNSKKTLSLLQDDFHKSVTMLHEQFLLKLADSPTFKTKNSEHESIIPYSIKI